MKYRVRHLVEFGLFRMISGLVNILPERGAFMVGWAIAFLMYRVCGFRKARAEQRIRSVMGEGLSDAEVRRIGWTAFRNVGFHAVELLRGHRVNEAWAKKHIINYPVLKERFLDRLAPGQGAIFTLPHANNWDLSMFCTKALGVPIFAISAPQRNPLYNAYITRTRDEVIGIETLMRGDKGLGRQVLKMLKGGKVLGILSDLREKTPALQIKFLGGTANIAEGMPVFAMHADVPVFPAFTRRVGWTKHEWKIYDPIFFPKEEDKTAVYQRGVQQIMEILEKDIRQYPDQYFWFNRRWVLDPVPAE